MAVRLNTNIRTNLAGVIKTAFDGGVLEIRTGSQPVSSNDAATGTLLASITLPSPAFADASGGAVAKTGTWSTTAVASGTAGWCRFKNGGDTLRLDGLITGTSGGGLIEISDVDLVQDGNVTVTSGSITMPSGE